MAQGIALTDFINEIEDSASDSTFYLDRQIINDNVRFARWSGQSTDGRKWSNRRVGLSLNGISTEGAISNNKPFPWEGASDSRVRLSETITNEEVRKMMIAFDRSKRRVAGTEQTDWQSAGQVGLLVDWMVKTQMLEAREEMRMASELRQGNGACLMRVWWHQEHDTDQKEVTLEELSVIAQEIPAIDELIALVMDGGLDDEAAEMLISFAPEIELKDAKRAVKDLRETGRAEYPIAYLKVNRPRWSARKIYRDVFFPTNTETIDSARWIADRYFLTENQVREKANSDGWSKSFINKVLEHKGKTSLDAWHERLNEGKFGAESSYELAMDDNDDLIEIFYVYSKDVNSKGIPATYVQPVSWHVKDEGAKKPALLNYKHGQYPFVKMQRELNARGMIQSRGIGELLQTDQASLKIQTDYGADRTSIDILPMFWVGADRAGVPMELGPGKQIPRKRSGIEEPIILPNAMGNTELTMRHIMERVNDYFGRNPEKPNETQIYNQSLVDDWLAEVRNVLSMTLALMQQFMDDQTTSIVLNTNEAPLHMTREAIQGKFDMSIQFDARDLDAEQVKQKIEGYKEAMGMDTEGTLDRSAVVKRFVEWIDPVGSLETIRPVQQVRMEDVTDEQDALTKIFGGIEPPFDPTDKNAQARLQIIQDSIQKNPQLMQRYQEDELYKGMIDARVAGYQQTIAQQENAQIGRTGTEPFLDSDKAQGLQQQNG
jgi:hypothetical protein